MVKTKTWGALGDCSDSQSAPGYGDRLLMIGMLVNALYNLVDAYFVSGLGESQMGAISARISSGAGDRRIGAAVRKRSCLLYFQAFGVGKT